MQEHVGRDDAFGQWISAGEVDHSTQRRSGGKPSSHHDLFDVEGRATNRDPSAAASAARIRNGDLDRVAWRYIQSVQPGCGPPGEGSAYRQSPRDRSQPQLRAFPEASPAVEA